MMIITNEAERLAIVKIMAMGGGIACLLVSVLLVYIYNRIFKSTGLWLICSLLTLVLIFGLGFYFLVWFDRNLL